MRVDVPGGVRVNTQLLGSFANKNQVFFICGAKHRKLTQNEKFVGFFSRGNKFFLTGTQTMCFEPKDLFSLSVPSARTKVGSNFGVPWKF